MTVRRTRPSIAGRSAEDIPADPLHLGRRKVTVADLFEVEGRGEREIAGRGAESESAPQNDRLCAIGEGMSEGCIEVHGSASDYLGRGMRRGHLRGSAGHCVGEGMRGRSHRGLEGCRGLCRGRRTGRERGHERG